MTALSNLRHRASRVLQQAYRVEGFRRAASLVKRRQSVLDFYVATPPDPQVTVDLFEGAWSSAFPPPLQGVRAGNAELFNDERILWASEQAGGVEGKSVLELGPLEGAHTYLMEKLGAQSVVAVESNSSAFMKCLIVKELTGLTKSRFLLADVTEYLKHTTQKYDIILASGLLYHMKDPIELVDLMYRRCSNHIMVWTHYYDPVVRPDKNNRFNGIVKIIYKNHTYSLHRYEYEGSLGWAGFCGGNASYSHWMERDDLFRLVESAGFRLVDVAFDDPEHPNGPALALVAQKVDPDSA